MAVCIIPLLGKLVIWSLYYQRKYLGKYSRSNNFDICIVWHNESKSLEAIIWLNKLEFLRRFGMDGKTTVKYLQNYIKQKDYHPELLKDYFLKVSEEVGELSRAMRKGLKAHNDDIKGTIDEELWDVMYYAIAIANIYEIDLE